MEPGETHDQHHGAHEFAAQLAEHLPMADRVAAEMHELAGDIGTEGEAEDRLLDGIRQAIADQPSAVGEGVDLAPIVALERDFDPAIFRTIARESFLKVREARSTRREQEDDGIMTPALEHEVDDQIFNDATPRHLHVASGLEIKDATIIAAAVQEGCEKLIVRFVATAEQIEIAEQAGRVISDEGSAHEFTEVWRFERDPSAESSATDARHAISSGPDNWLFAHRGWVVTDIQSTDA